MPTKKHPTLATRLSAAKVRQAEAEAALTEQTLQNMKIPHPQAESPVEQAEPVGIHTGVLRQLVIDDYIALRDGAITEANAATRASFARSILDTVKLEQGALEGAVRTAVEL